jgi:GNAT superfamily N-acetyltransferase
VKDAASVSPDTAERLRAIHDEAFAPDERQYSMDHMLERSGHADRILRIIELDQRAVGYAYLELAPRAASAFLWYVAVSAELRGRGIGRMAIDDTLLMLRREHPELRYALFEVARPVRPEDPAEPTEDRRLLEFYRRLGAYWVRGVDYVIPSADASSRSVAYEPMFFVLAGTIDGSEIRRAILVMAEDNYEDRPDDPRWIRLQRSVEHATITPPDGGGGEIAGARETSADGTFTA